MTYPEHEVYGQWRLYGDAIQRKYRELSAKPPRDDVHSELYHRILERGLTSGGRGFNMDKLFRRVVNADLPDEIIAFERALYSADQLFQSQDLAHTS